MSLRDFRPEPDPMMEELYQIRDDISAHLLTLSPQERVDWINGRAHETAEKYGFELRPHPDDPQCKQLVRKPA